MNVYANTLISLVSLALLWFFLFWLYKDLCVDHFRQRVFALRDELFDAATSGKIPFDHKAYGRLRVTMNGAIRFAYQISLLHFLVVIARHGGHISRNNGYNAKFLEEMQDLSEEQKKVFVSFHMRFSLLFLKQIFVSSPLFLVTIIFPLLTYFLFREFASWFLNNLRAPLEEMETMAYAVGED